MGITINNSNSSNFGMSKAYVNILQLNNSFALPPQFSTMGTNSNVFSYMSTIRNSKLIKRYGKS